MGSIPEGCTGVELINPRGDFEKHNVRYVGIKTRRKVKNLKKDYGVECINISLPRDYHTYLVNQIRHMCIKENRRVTMSEIVRDALYAKYPCPKTMDMFGGKLDERKGNKK